MTFVWHLVCNSFCYLFLDSELAFAATSTSVLSHGGAQVGKHRHKLKFETLCCLMVLWSWFNEGLVPKAKVTMEMFQDLRTWHRAGV